MTGQRVLLGALTVLTALLLQTSVLPRLPLPGQEPELLVVVVVAFALAGGAGTGAVTGFAAGLAADLVADHSLGRLALVLAVVGHLAGQVRLGVDRSRLLPLGVVGAAAAGAVLLYAAEGLVLADGRVSGAAVVRSLTSSVPYAVALTPLAVPWIGRLVNRVDPRVDRGRLPGRRPR